MVSDAVSLRRTLKFGRMFRVPVHIHRLGHEIMSMMGDSFSDITDEGIIKYAFQL